MHPAERWRKLESLYHAAQERPPYERSAFLTAACSGDDALRQEVEALLKDETKARDWLSTQAAEMAARMVAPETAPASLIGHRMGSYQIVGLLGAGGMGEVYQARDAKLGRDVAIKVLPPAFIHDTERLARFEREARILAALNHPNIGSLYGFEESDGITGLVLELVEGSTLAQRISRGRVPIDEALTLAGQIAQALKAAHDRGILHRDLKPANIKLSADGNIKVLDFGLAKIMTGDGSARHLSHSPTMTVGATSEGIVLGTPAYMSPEQARGQAVDERTDLWAFGCVLYEMLTGRAPFAAGNISDTIAAILEREPDWRALPSATPSAIHRLLRRCLRKDVRRRLHDAADAKIEIDDATSPSTDDPAVALRNDTDRRLLWLATGSLLLAVAAIAFAFSRSHAPATPTAPLTTARIVASQLTNYGGTESGGALSPDGRSFVFVSNYHGTPDIYLRQVSGGEPVRVTNDAAEEALPAFAPDGDSIYFTRIDEAGTGIWRTGALGGEPRKVLDNALTPVPSPDGKRLAYVTRRDDGFTLGVMALDGSGARTLVERIRTGTFRPAWSPDGRWLTYSNWALFGPVDVFVVDATTGHQRRVAQLLSAGANDGGQPVWLPDNRHLVISYSPLARQQAPADLGILDTQDGSILRLTTTVGDGLYSPSISADGSRLIATRLHYYREIWKVPLGSDPDANGRAAVRLVSESAGPMWTFVSRDGRTVLFNSPASGSRNLWTTSPEPGAAVSQITTVPQDAVSHSSLSPDGTYVAFASIASGHSDVWTQRVDGSNLRQLTNDEPADSWPVWSPDGAWIVYQSYRGDRSETWRIRTSGGPPEKLLAQGFRGDWIRQPAGSGTWIATTGSSTGSGVRLIDVETREIVWDQPIPGGSLSLPVFRSDGRAISAPFREDRVHDVVRIFDATTGASRIAARLPFHITFRADWTDEGRAVVVNRSDEVSHIVMFDRFWLNDRGQ